MCSLSSVYIACVYILGVIIQSYLYAELKILELFGGCVSMEWCFFTFYSHAKLHSNCNSLAHTGQRPRLPPTLLHSYSYFSHTHFYSVKHIHIPINCFSSLGGVSIPWCTVMEPPGGLWLAWITEHPSETVASSFLSSRSGGGCSVETHFRVVTVFLPHTRKTVYAGNVRFNGNKGNWVNLFFKHFIDLRFYILTCRTTCTQHSLVQEISNK